MSTGIPKIIHLAWKNKNILNNKSPLVIHGVKKLIALNPNWKATVHEDEEIDEYLKKTLDQSDYNLIKNKHVVQKTDIWRLFKIYLEGGLYVDIDRLCNKKIDPLLGENVKWVLPTCIDHDFSHDLMMSSPGNPVFLETIKLYLQRRREGHTNVYFLGAQTYMHAITKVVLNEMIDTNPGIEKFNWIRKEFEKIPFIKLVRETPPYNTFLYSSKKKVFDHEKMKRQLYKDTYIKHWTGEW